MYFYATKPEFISPWNLCIKAKPWFMAYGCFMEDIELGSHLSIKAKYFWPEGDRFRQVPLYNLKRNCIRCYNILYIITNIAESLIPKHHTQSCIVSVHKMNMHVHAMKYEYRIY